EGLEGREVVRQALEAGRQQAAVPHLAGQELNGERQASGRQDFLVDVVQQFLRGGALQPLAQRAEEGRLLDVLFAVGDLRRTHAAIVPPELIHHKGTKDTKKDKEEKQGR